MICAEAKLKLEPCVSGTLSPEDRIALEEHLATCEGCRLELELTRAVMGAPSFESADEPPAASAAPSAETPTHEPPAPEPEAPASMPEHGEARASTPLFDEISFANLESEPPAAGAGPGASPAAAPDASETDPFANFTPKPEEPAAQSSATWDFEPAEVPRDSSPPEGSLSFANEALKRKREVDEKRKTTLVRLALWGGGIGCGLVLLGVSVWIALAFRQEKAPEFGPNGETPAVTPNQETAPPPDSTVAPNSPGGSATPAPVTTQSTTSAPAQPTASTATQPTPDSGAPPQAAPTILDATPGVAASPGPPPPDATKSGSRAAKGKPKPGTQASTKPKNASSGDDELFPWKPVDDVPSAPRVAARITRIQPAPDAGTPKPVQPEPAPPPQPAPVNPPEATQQEQGTGQSGAPVAPSAGTTAPANPSPQPAGGTAQPQPAGETAQPQQDAASMRPIDRLHLATETAAKNADLVALRKLKSSWKSMIGSTAGPDRTRAKLEYADCLWSIQEISGRNSDRRDALTAYRDYVLYAPAGGTNSRTVGRMRYLEDVLTDK